MTTFLKTILFFSLILLLGCQLQNNKTSPLIPKDMTNQNERNNKLLVFVGEKIEVNPLPRKKGDFDNACKAKYKVLQKVYGDYSKDFIEFEAYDHYEIPPFSKYKNALLFISALDGKYYHEKYMYNDVYRTKDGRWAGSYPREDYDHEYNTHTTVKPEKIEFVEEVLYPIKVKGEDGKETVTLILSLTSNMLETKPLPYTEITLKTCLN